MSDLSKRIAALPPEKRQLFEKLLKQERLDIQKPTIPLQPRAHGTNKFVTSFAQQRLWFLDSFEPHSSAYNMPAALRLTGALNVDALERTRTEVSRRHEALRTRFDVQDGEPVQVIDEPTPFLLTVTEVEAVAQEQRVAELIKAEASRPFDLATGPLVRAQLLKLSDLEHVLLFTMHHIISDGWSMGVLIKEVATLYNAYVQGAESPLEELPIQYADYAVWQREWLQGDALEQQLDY
jgi:hypothetical protein